MRIPCHAARDELTGVKILGLVVEGDRAGDTWYRVHYACCDKVTELSHAQLDRRRRRGSTMCVACAKEATGRALARVAMANRGLEREWDNRSKLNDYGVSMPAWPVPSGAVGRNYIGR
jgi:hypothetical protein